MLCAMILGLTGGLGCGKSTAASMFAAHGFAALDSDAIVRDVVLKEPAVIGALREGRPGQLDDQKAVVRVACLDAEEAGLLRGKVAGGNANELIMRHPILK